MIRLPCQHVVFFKIFFFSICLYGKLSHHGFHINILYLSKLDLSFVDFSYACLKNVFSSRADIHRAKLRIIKWNPWFVLRNNANIVMTPFLLSKDNIDLQFATKHLGQFLLTRLLLDNMKKTARESKKEGRIVNVSSEAHMLTYPEGILFDKI